MDESLTITLDYGKYGPRSHVHCVDEANEENTAQVEEEVEPLVYLDRDLIGQDLSYRHCYSHDHQDFCVEGR